MATLGEYLALRLRILDVVDDARVALHAAEFLDAEADLVAHWPDWRWREIHQRWCRLHPTSRQHAGDDGLNAELCEYLLRAVMPVALDPAKRPLLVIADQVTAAVLRASSAPYPMDQDAGR